MPQMIEEVVAPLLVGSYLQMGTLCSQITNLEEYLNPNVVKVICDQRQRAIENGVATHIMTTECECHAADSPMDLQKVEALMRAKKSALSGIKNLRRRWYIVQIIHRPIQHHALLPLG